MNIENTKEIEARRRAKASLNLIMDAKDCSVEDLKHALLWYADRFDQTRLMVNKVNLLAIFSPNPESEIIKQLISKLAKEADTEGLHIVYGDMAKGDTV